MDPDDLVLDDLIERAFTSMLKSLDAVVDVEQRLTDLCRDFGLNSELTQDQSPHAL